MIFLNAKVKSGHKIRGFGYDVSKFILRQPLVTIDVPFQKDLKIFEK